MRFNLSDLTFYYGNHTMATITGTIKQANRLPLRTFNGCVAAAYAFQAARKVANDMATAYDIAGDSLSRNHYEFIVTYCNDMMEDATSAALRRL